jgi:c(7)-type cytochrome triheme protein
MAKIQAGESCGACHGSVAFDIERACNRCHTGFPSQPKWRPREAPRAPIERAHSWDKAQALLPVTAGAADWDKALAEGVIAPRPGLEPAATARPVLPLDVALVPTGSAALKVVFPHQSHTEWLGCESCHPALFQMAKGANPITMAKIQAGEYCGACHGKVAFDIEEACDRCHTAFPTRAERRPREAPRAPIERAHSWVDAQALLPVTAGAADWAKALAEEVIAPRPGLEPAAAARPVLPLDVELIPGGSAAFKAIFPHQAHTELLGCESCHPALFQMAKGANPITMAKIQAGEYCGACHGKVAFDIEEACDRCHTAFPTRAERRPREAPRTPIEGAHSWVDAQALLPVTAGAADWTKALAEEVIAPRPGLEPAATARPVLPMDVELIPEGNAPFKVVFPHQAHTEWLGCESCHPALFQMAKGANAITMAKIQAGEYCGACHGKVAFPVEACGRCHAILAGGN